jgi:hypothetical protein
MDPGLPGALLNPARNRALNRAESRYWDYKVELHLTDPYRIAEFAKDVLAFHNTEGGLIIVGIADSYAVLGVSENTILDASKLRDKIMRFAGPSVDVFQDSIEIIDHRYIWLIFVRKYVNAPQSVERDGPIGAGGRHVFRRGTYFYRDGDRVKYCESYGDIERVFRGLASERLSAYNYDIDEPYFRLLNPNWDKFVGRRGKINEVKQKLTLRHPVVALDGLGGVGKTALAVKVVKELYEEKGRYA